MMRRVAQSILRLMPDFFLFIFDFPVQKESQNCPQNDDTGDDQDLIHRAHDYGAQDCTSALDLKPHGQTFCQEQAGVRPFFDVVDGSANTGDGDERAVKNIDCSSIWYVL